jgi:multisubunit Na+/H+ antiporter MnhB subunit
LQAKLREDKIVAGRRRRGRRRTKKANSTIVGAVLVFVIFLTVAYLYFYTVMQEEQYYTNINLLAGINASQKAQESLIITGMLVGPLIGFTVNNTGITATISSFLITDKSSGQVAYNSGGSSTPILPYAISQGQSVVFTTSDIYTQGHFYTIEVQTQRGNTFAGTYPPRQLNINVVNALVAAGIGSISMVFSTYTFYNVTGGGSNWNIDINHPHQGGLLPYNVQPAFSLSVTNNDPSVGTIVVDSHTEIYLYETCRNGCGGNVPIFAYFVVNVGSGGAITSTSTGSFVPISIPYKATKVLYFASTNDISLGSFATQAMSGPGGKVGLGEYDVFVIIHGTDTLSTGGVLYSQNLPFAGSFLADNVAWPNQTPITCTHSSTTNFALTVTNSQLSTSSVKKITVNATGFSSLSASNAGSFTASISGTLITWQSGSIGAGNSMTFRWTGKAPATVGAEDITPIMITFNSGTMVLQQAASGCFIQ